MLGCCERSQFKYAFLHLYEHPRDAEHKKKHIRRLSEYCIGFISNIFHLDVCGFGSFREATAVVRF